MKCFIWNWEIIKGHKMALQVRTSIIPTSIFGNVVNMDLILSTLTISNRFPKTYTLINLILRAALNFLY
jgi:hypothetical protein